MILRWWSARKRAHIVRCRFGELSNPRPREARLCDASNLVAKRKVAKIIEGVKKRGYLRGREKKY